MTNKTLKATLALGHFEQVFRLYLHIIADLKISPDSEKSEFIELMVRGVSWEILKAFAKKVKVGQRDFEKIKNSHEFVRYITELASSLNDTQYKNFANDITQIYINAIEKTSGFQDQKLQVISRRFAEFFESNS